MSYCAVDTLTKCLECKICPFDNVDDIAKERKRHWRYSSGMRTELDSPELSVMLYICDPTAGEAEIGRSLGLTSQPASLA